MEFAGGKELANITKDMGNMFQQATSGVFGLYQSLFSVPGKIMEWSEMLVTSKEAIKNYNANLALAFAEKDRRAILRGIRSGAATGGAALELQRAWDDMKDKMQPMQDQLYLVAAEGLKILIQFMNNNSKILLTVAKFDPVIGLFVTVLEGISKWIGTSTIPTTTLGEDLMTFMTRWETGPNTKRPGDPMSRGRR